MKKLDTIVFQGLFEGSLSFMLSQASLKSQRPAGYCRANGRYRKKNCSNFENSNQLQRKLGSFFFLIRLLYSVNP